MRFVPLICATVLLCLGCDAQDEGPYNLAGYWERSTDAQCVGNIDEDFLSGQLYTTYSGLDRMMIEQDGNDLVLVLGEGQYEREEAVLEGDTIRLLSPQPAGWIAGCVEGSYWCELWFDRTFTVLDDGRTIMVEENYESQGHVTVCTHEWNRHK